MCSRRAFPPGRSTPPTLGRRRSKRPSGRAGVDHFQRAGQDRRAAGVGVVDATIVVAVSAAEDDRAAAERCRSRSNCPGRKGRRGIRLVAIEHHGLAVGIDRRHVAGGSADRDGHGKLDQRPDGGLERPGGEVEDGRSLRGRSDCTWSSPPLRLYVPDSRRPAATNSNIWRRVGSARLREDSRAAAAHVLVRSWLTTNSPCAEVVESLAAACAIDADLPLKRH